jgi:hypothetical protein
VRRSFVRKDQDPLGRLFEVEVVAGRVRVTFEPDSPSTATSLVMDRSAADRMATELQLAVDDLVVGP